jgi:hypothetical protein
MKMICCDCPQHQQCRASYGACPRRFSPIQQVASGLFEPAQTYVDPWPFRTERQLVDALRDADSDGGECD